ncbi:MAG: HAD family hydrolase [Verrucomicrobiota bacterium]
MTTNELITRIAALSQPLAPLPTGRMPQPLAHGIRIRAILFDIYGTLFVSASGDIGSDAAQNSARAAEQAFAQTGLTTRPSSIDGATIVQWYENTVGQLQQERRVRTPTIKHPEIEIRRVWKRVLEQLNINGSEKTVERLAVEYECRVNPTWPMPNALEILRKLQIKGLPVGIVSNSQFYTPLLFPALMRTTLADLGVDDNLSAWSYRLLEAKPSPRLFEQALEGLHRKHNIAPAETLYVGNDMLNDVWAANQAGCRTALFAGDRRSLRQRESVPECDALHPDAILTNLNQLDPQLS